MSAYLIALVDVIEPAQYEDYKKLTPHAIATNGGRFLVRGGQAEALEGPQEDRRVVVLEFDSVEQARAFWDSPEYLEARDVRAGAAEMQAFILPGA